MCAVIDAQVAHVAGVVRVVSVCNCSSTGLVLTGEDERADYNDVSQGARKGARVAPVGEERS